MSGHHVVKDGLRATLRAARRQLSADRRGVESAAASGRCLKLVGDGPCASYMAMRDELDLDALHRALWAVGRSVLLPRVIGDGALAWHAVAAPEQLAPGAFGICEPDPRLTPVSALPEAATVLVPGVGFDRAGRRLGQGGGFYDRLLTSRPDLRSIGVGFTCQLVEAVPVEAHDRALRGLVIAGELVRDPDPT